MGLSWLSFFLLESTPSSYNHGSVKNGCISNNGYLSNTAIFKLNHDFGRNSKQKAIPLIVTGSKMNS